jgi:citrate synthase
MVEEAVEQGTATALGAALDRHGSIPGFGHPLYPDGDPRARLLLSMVADTAGMQPSVRAGRQLVERCRRHSGSEPNIDFALAVLSTTARMAPGAGETIFTIARTAGWVAHAIEEYTAPPLRFRARAVALPASAARSAQQP